MTPETHTDDLPEEAAETGAAEETPKLSLDIKIDKPSACERHVTVSISRADVDRYIGEAYDELMPKAEVPGFRPGRAPRKLVESRFKEQIGDQVKGKLLMDSMGQVSDESGFSAISEPDFDFDAIEVPSEGPMVFEFDIEVRPEFDLPEWKGLKIERPVREFSDEDVDKHMRNLLARYAEILKKEGAAAKDDYVSLDMTFRDEGREIAHHKAVQVRVRPTLTFHDGVVEGFEKLMVGATAGDRRQGKVAISHDSENESLRGKELEVQFTVNEVRELQLPQIDDDLLAQIGEFESEEELRDAVQREMDRQLVYHQQRRIREQITATLTESADWELPPDLLRRQSHRELDRAVMELQSSGFSAEEIRAHENELRRNSRASTARALKEHFILERIAEEEEIAADEDDFNREIALIAYSQGDSPRRVRARLEKRGQMDALRNQVIERKVIEAITEHAEFKEVPFTPREATEEAVDFAIGGESDAAIPEAKHGGEAEPLSQPADRT
jgi:trigger factor